MSKEVFEEQDNHNMYSGQQGQYGISSGYEKIWDRLKEDIGIPNIIALFLGAILLIFSPDKGWGFDIPCLNYTLAYRGWLGILCFIYVFISIFGKKRKVLPEAKIPINISEEILPKAETPKDEVLSSKNEIILPEAEEISSETETLKDEILPTENETRIYETEEMPLETETPKDETLPAEGIKPTMIKSMYVHFPSNRSNALEFMTGQLNQCNDYASAMLLLVGFEKLFDGKLYFSTLPQSAATNGSVPTLGKGKSKWSWWYWDGEDKGFQLLVSLCQ